MQLSESCGRTHARCFMSSNAEARGTASPRDPGLIQAVLEYLAALDHDHPPARCECSLPCSLFSHTYW